MICGERMRSGLPERDAAVARAVDELWILTVGGGHQPAAPGRRLRLSTVIASSGSRRTLGADAAHGGEDRGVVAAAEAAADLRQALVGELAREVHRDLAGPGDLRAGGRARGAAPG